ncbi:MAG: hypothetical protein HKO59_15890 [Phycisphaerales bacterium]|nr:hypothetical protein [Phycisphaerae bacterium]NNF43999.1 hypothetical protein [Phycisphaerales bacterium]NNM27437.1 hypothetical protein [Phycisphaerales bacterium]
MASPTRCGGYRSSLSCLAVAAAMVASAQAADIPKAAMPSIAGVAAYELQALTLPPAAEEPRAFNTRVTLDGVEYELELEPYSVRAADFAVLVPDGDGGLTEHPVGPPATYRGVVLNAPGSAVALSRVGDELTGTIRLGADDDFYAIQPLAELGVTGFAGGDHVTYRSADVEATDHRCGADDIEQPFAGIEDHAAAGDDPTDGTGLEIVDLAVDADFQFFQLNGSSVLNTVNDIEDVLSTLEFIYERDVDISYEITRIVIRTSAAENPYTSSSSGTLLCQFRNEWNSAPENTIQRDIAQLFTGRNLIGGTIGVAWLGTICNQFLNVCGSFNNAGYSVVESRFTTFFTSRVALSAHELGHNWAAGHCDAAGTCRIMCSGLGSCGSVSSFAPVSINAINAFASTLSCLRDVPDALDVPFFEDVPTGNVDETRWLYNWKASASTAAVAEPSPIRSLELSATGSGPYQDDDLRSNAIRLGGLSDQFLSFYSQHRGVPATGKLFVEYWLSGNEWKLLETVTSDGVDQDAFVFHSIELPGSAYHNEFRVRFRVDVDSSAQRWFIDDILVGDEVTPCPADLDGSGDIGFTDLLQVLAAWGPCAGCPQDLDGSGDVGFTDLLTVLSAWGPC